MILRIFVSALCGMNLPTLFYGLINFFAFLDSHVQALLSLFERESNTKRIKKRFAVLSHFTSPDTFRSENETAESRRKRIRRKFAERKLFREKISPHLPRCTFLQLPSKKSPTNIPPYRDPKGMCPFGRAPRQRLGRSMRQSLMKNLHKRTSFLQKTMIQ